MAASQTEICLIEFLLFLGIPLLRALQSLIAAAIVQLEVLEGELLSQLVFSNVVQAEIEIAVGLAEAAVSELQNVLSALPLGAFQECAPAATFVSNFRSSFTTVLNYFDEVTNEANRVKSFSDLRSAASSQIDYQINYLQTLNSNIDVIVEAIARGQSISDLVQSPSLAPLPQPPTFSSLV